jgi:hypothetical protein
MAVFITGPDSNLTRLAGNLPSTPSQKPYASSESLAPVHPDFPMDGCLETHKVRSVTVQLFQHDDLVTCYEHQISRCFRYIVFDPAQSTRTVVSVRGCSKDYNRNSRNGFPNTSK